MTRIMSPYAKFAEELGWVKRSQADPLPHQQVLTPEYMKKLTMLVRTKFSGSNVESTESGTIYVKGQASKNIEYEFTIFITPTTSLMLDVAISGSVYGNVLYPAKFYQPESDEAHKGGVTSLPFQAGTSVFPDDDPAKLVDWIYNEVDRRVKQVMMKFKQ